MKTETLSFELSKRLSDAGLLDEVETEYYIVKFGSGACKRRKEKDLKYSYGKKEYYKTLTLSEAIEFLPETINLYNTEYCLCMFKKSIEYCTFEHSEFIIKEEGKTLLEAIEKMLNYLLDNNLLGQK